MRALCFSPPCKDPSYDVSGDVFSVSPGLMATRSTGWVRVTSADPRAPLEVQPNYLAEPADLDALVESVGTVFDLVATSGYARLSAGPAAPVRRPTSRAETVEFVRRSVDRFFHSAGTAAMGTGERSVVGPDLAVHGLEGLYVCDASVFPSLPTSNTQAPVIAVAERAAGLFLGRARARGRRAGGQSSRGSTRVSTTPWSSRRTT